MAKIELTRHDYTYDYIEFDRIEYKIIKHTTPKRSLFFTPDEATALKALLNERTDI